LGLTPVEIRHLRFGRRFFGYRRGPVDDALEEIVDSFENVWRDRADLADRVEELEASLVRYRELEELLRQTLVSAERAAHELKSQAAREAELIVQEAHAEARAVVREATAERERLVGETNRVRALLGAALATLGDGEVPAQAA
jgi:cell division initiation protein